MVDLVSSQSPPHVLYPSESISNPSSLMPSQLSSMPLQVSTAPGRIAELVSSQSPWQAVRPSASLSNSSVPVNAGHLGLLQSLLRPSAQICGAPPNTEALLSSQSPVQMLKPSPSASECGPAPKALPP